MENAEDEERVEEERIGERVDEDSKTEEFVPPPLFMDIFSSPPPASQPVFVYRPPAPHEKSSPSSTTTPKSELHGVPTSSSSAQASRSRKAPAKRASSVVPITSPAIHGGAQQADVIKSAAAVPATVVPTPGLVLCDNASAGKPIDDHDNPLPLPEVTSSAAESIPNAELEECAQAFVELDSKEAQLTEAREKVIQQLKSLGGTVSTSSRKPQATGNENLTKTLDGAGVHWDYLLKEMAWMSNDFRVERKWKVQSAKKLVKETERVINRKETEKKQESSKRAISLRRHAGKVAREVRKSFWEKIDRIVLFKNNAEFVAEQQEIMDRNLDRLLVQTERYSESLIATATSLSKKRRRAERQSEAERQRKLEEVEHQAILELMSKYSFGKPSVATSRKRLKTSKNDEPKGTSQARVAKEEKTSTNQIGTGTIDVDMNDAATDESWSKSETEDSEEISDGDVENTYDDGTADKLNADMDIPLDELLRREYGITSNGNGAGAGEHQWTTEKKQEAKSSARSSSRPAAATPGGDEEDDESWHGEEEAEEDEEDIDVEDIQNPDDDGNVNSLQADMDLPLEELLAKMYGITEEHLKNDSNAAGTSSTRGKDKVKKREAVTSPSVPSAPEDSDGSRGSGEDESWNEMGQEEVDEDIDEEDELNAEDDGNPEGLEDDLNMSIEELLAKRYGIQPEPPTAETSTSTSSSNLKILLEEVVEEEMQDDDSFVPSGDEVDDEETLHEAEATIHDDCTVQQLQADAEVPLEELLNREYHGFGKEDVQSKELGDEVEANGKELGDEVEANGRPLSKKKAKTVQTTTPSERGKENAVASKQEEEEVLIPFLLSKDRPLRAYQHEGLNWLVSLHDRQLNGILADEMGLGKTAQTIALLAHLAGACNIWGPHLIVVPTSVILNWDMEFKTWCPGLKVLTYFGSSAERAAKRSGWTKPNAFHVCVTSYQLAVQDASVFRRKKWYYIICDEAHALKNSKSQRWQTLLSFQAKRRLLITGTPLQNSLMELWSLMHFLMPEVFRSQHEFKHWFSNPLQAIVEEGDKRNAAAVKRLHAVMRPFILRRLKRDVATQLPSKFEHVVRLPLARRQRFLYEDFISLNSTQNALRSGGYIDKMAIMMKLRMVCNHPDLFEPRLVASAFCVDEMVVPFPRSVLDIYEPAVEEFPIETFLCDREFSSPDQAETTTRIVPESVTLRSKLVATRINELAPDPEQLSAVCMAIAKAESIPKPWKMEEEFAPGLYAAVPRDVKSKVSLLYQERTAKTLNEKKSSSSLLVSNNHRRIQETVPVMGEELISTCASLLLHAQCQRLPASLYLYDDSIDKRLKDLGPVLDRFVFVTPVAQGTLRMPMNRNQKRSESQSDLLLRSVKATPAIEEGEFLLHPIAIRQRVSFPDRYLVQYDCGKLQTLAVMLHRLKRDNHRVLIFTQMSRMLDILERFLNLHSHTYFRLDGSTKVEERQSMMDRFNRDPRIFCFILSTRSGGLGINLTGADTVIFYDSDWNPSMDAQAQDRAHRIGQTKNVHIYRLVSEQTIEENILIKSNQKRYLNKLSVEEGNFSSLLLPGAGGGASGKNGQLMAEVYNDIVSSTREDLLSQVEDESDRLAAKRAKEEEQVMKEEEQGVFRDDDNNTATTSTTTNGGSGAAKAAGDDQEEEPSGNPDDQDKLEDAQGNVMMTMAQFQELESKLKPIDQYGIEFRNKYFVVYDPLKESRRKKELEKAQLIEEQTKDWELETLERNKRLAEREAEEDLVADKNSRLSEAEAEANFKSAQRCYRMERKLMRMTGRGWRLTYEKGHGDRKPYYFEEHTKEITWERPRILDAEEERRLAWSKGWSSLPLSALTRVAWFLPPSDCRNRFNRVCANWWRAVDGNVAFCTWVDPSPPLHSSSTTASLSPMKKKTLMSSSSSSNPDTTMAASNEFMTVGTPVEARHQGLEYWYAATVVDSHSDGTLNVLYTDGELEKNVRRDLVRKDRGARITLIKPLDGGVGGPMLEMVNEHLASNFGCGCTLPDPEQALTVKDVLKPSGGDSLGQVLVLKAGRHEVLNSSNSSNGTNNEGATASDSSWFCRPGMRIVGEMFWAREKNAFETATARVLPDNEGPRGGKKASIATTKIDASAIDVLDPCRASIVSSNSLDVALICGGEITGVAFQVRVVVDAQPFQTSPLFIECSFSKGVELIGGGGVVFDSCQFVGNSTGPAIAVRKNMDSLVLSRCRIANNRVGIDFASEFNNFDSVKIHSVEFKSNRLGAVSGPIAAAVSSTPLVSSSAVAAGPSSAGALSPSPAASPPTDQTVDPLEQQPTSAVGESVIASTSPSLVQTGGEDATSSSIESPPVLGETSSSASSTLAVGGQQQSSMDPSATQIPLVPVAPSSAGEAQEQPTMEVEKPPTENSSSSSPALPTIPQLSPSPTTTMTPFQIWKQQNAALLASQQHSKYVRPKFPPLKIMVERFRPVVIGTKPAVTSKGGGSRATSTTPNSAGPTIGESSTTTPTATNIVESIAPLRGSKSKKRQGNGPEGEKPSTDKSTTKRAKRDVPLSLTHSGSGGEAIVFE